MLKKIEKIEAETIYGGATKDCWDMVGNFFTMVGTGGGAFVTGTVAVLDPELITKVGAGFVSVAAAGGMINSAVALQENMQECRSGNPPKQISYSNTESVYISGGRTISNRASITY